ncbi:putative two-component system response regulator [Desulfuromusa kysingii]|uniref:Putative two-component system response regulator n=1 Tax=Desulfuromusa kysingii TaxID=37625 RepID=A0A1H3ZW29_9BACT|nr:HD domain-containing phosphohydrolase [Desulfuromusa kysingii]SEA27870.1 putative two-component system response regulator [Desulfuromusa kysingii]
MKILICEDEFVSRRKLEKIIGSLGYELLIAEDGLEAYELWENERPELIISDWVMPHLTGIELCQKIRAAEGSQYTYILMVTTKHETSDIVTAIEAGADDFISKPYVIEELAVRIRAGQRSRMFQTKDIVIFSLAKLAETRDTETGNHLEHIRYFSKLLAEQLATLPDNPLRINKMFVENIFLTSPLHDIGKVGIADAILLKPGRLTESEHDAMKEHCQIGYNTLHDALEKYPNTDYLQMGAEIALYHHEKYDGSGYPKGLTAEKIPLAARIVALADVYDALTSIRPYKVAYTHQQTIEIIINDSGSHFDPMIVAAFLQCEEQFSQTKQKFS